MKGARKIGVIALLTSTVAATVQAELNINEQRAKFHYQMSCQGCHTGDGAGYNSVPKLKGELGRFLQSQAGREYLVRVPGSANAALTNEQLAEVLNWMLLQFSGDSLTADWRPYQADEVAAYRRAPLLEVVRYRQQLVASLASDGSKERDE